MQMQRSSIPVQFSLYSLVAVGVIALWVAVLWVRSIPLSRCPQKCQSFTTMVVHDPYCTIDPVCTSPFYDAGWRQGGFEADKPPRWQGRVWLHDQNTYGIGGVPLLAIPNYFAFLLAMGAVAAVVQRRVDSRRVRRLFLTALFAWITLEVFRWLTSVARLDPDLTLLDILFDRSFFGIWATTVLLVGVIVVVARRPTSGASRSAKCSS